MTRLIDARDRALALVVAPAGYGKSTLIAHWAEWDDRAFLRISLAGCRGNATRQALGSLAEQLEAEAWPTDINASERPDDARERLGAAVQLVSAVRGHFVLVLDDAHRVPAGLLRKALEPLLKNLPEQCTLAVVSRTEPALPLGALRASRELVEIRGTDLALTPAEAAELLRREGQRLDFGAVHELVRRTEGWPAGLYLAALSLPGHESPQAGVEHFGGNDHRVAEYLRDEVLNAIGPDLLQFALRTSILDELTGPVCDAVLKTRGSPSRLTELAGLSPFLSPVDEAHDAFRWHRMLREALTSQLRREDPELVPQLNLRASAWFESQGQLDRAIHHASCALDADRVSHLLWPNIAFYLGRGEANRVQLWLGRFSPGDLAGHPQLALSAAYSSLVDGQFEHARRWSTVARGAWEAAGAAESIPSLAAGLATIESAFSHDVPGMLELAGGSVADEPADSPWRPVALFLSGTASHLGGDHVQAQKVLAEAWELGVVAAPLVSVLSLAQSTMIALEQKDWDAAGELTDRAESLMQRRELTDCSVAALAFAAGAASRAHAGRADEAKQMLRRARHLLDRSDDFIPWYGAEIRLLAAHASLWLADVVGARTLLAEASRLARRADGAMIFQAWFDEAWRYIDTLAETSLVGPSSLTIAELRVLRFLPSHRSFREIGSQLGVSANTIKTQAHAIYRKLGVASRSEAVAQASAAGLLGQ